MVANVPLAAAALFMKKEGPRQSMARQYKNRTFVFALLLGFLLASSLVGRFLLLPVSVPYPAAPFTANGSQTREMHYLEEVARPVISVSSTAEPPKGTGPTEGSAVRQAAPDARTRNASELATVYVVE